LQRRRSLPKPPFLCDLTLEQELEAFERLKPRLSTVWDVVSSDTEMPATSIVVPSLTLDPGAAPGDRVDAIRERVRPILDGARLPAAVA
jgi:hypothetical protein